MRTAWVAVAVWAILGGAAAAQEKKRPNVVVVITDDQRWNAMSCAGHPHLKTPNLDRLAAQGVRFKNAFCTTSLCSPSRASILSGQYAFKHGVRNNFTEFPADLPSLPRLLQSIGYVTGYIGKWHMGEDNDLPRPGFDYWVSHKGQGKYFDNDFYVQDRRKTVPGYYTTAVTDFALDWIKGRKKDRPFCLMLGHKAPHSFYVPEPKYAKAFDHVKVEYPQTAFQLHSKPEWVKSRLTTWHGIYGPLFEYRKKFPDARPEAVADFQAMVRGYMGTILSVDDSVGRMLKTLEDEGLLDDTIFVFVSDNGLLEGEHGMVDKRTMHEPSIRVITLVRYPGLTPTNQPKTVDGMILHADLAPSILDLCGGPKMANVHGRSWTTLVRQGDPEWRKAWVYEYNYEKQFPYTPNIRGVRTSEWSFMRYPHGDGTPDRHKAELYHLPTDPDQVRNLVDDAKHGGALREMRALLERTSRELGMVPDVMPLDEGIKQTLPDLKIR